MYSDLPPSDAEQQLELLRSINERLRTTNELLRWIREVAIFIAVLLGLLLYPRLSHAAHHRSNWARAEFAREHPCPNPAGHGTHCPGYVIDHRQALCVGGVDAPSNMAWMTVEEAKAKDRWECKPGWQQRLQSIR